MWFSCRYGLPELLDMVLSILIVVHIVRVDRIGFLTFLEEKFFVNSVGYVKLMRDT